MHAIPGNYAAWVAWLDAFGRGEDLSFGHLVPIDDSLGPDMFERLTWHVTEAFEARMNRWMDLMVRDQSLGPLTPMTLGRKLHDASRSLAPLARFTRLVLLPDAVRVRLGTDLVENVTLVQRELDKSVRREPRAEQRLLGVIRDQSLLHGLTTQAVEVASTTAAPSTGRRSRVIT